LKNPIVIHPYLFALFPVSSLYAHNIDQVPIRSALAAMAGSLIIAGVVLNLLRLIFRDTAKAGVLTTTILIIFFSYGHIHAVILNWMAEMFMYKANFRVINNITKYEIFIHLFLLLAFSLGMVRLLRAGWEHFRHAHSTKILNVISALLVVLSLGNIALRRGGDFEKWKYSHDENAKLLTADPIEKKRDIYYIILDGYGRADILEEFYEFDNSGFINNLEAKGFYVTAESCSNYAWTSLSLSSTLHLEYVNYFTEALGKSSINLRVPYEMIKNNRVVGFLKSQGYTFVHFNSTWGATLTNKYADRQIGYQLGIFRDEFLRILARSTMLKLVDPLIVKNLAEIHLNTFRVLETIPEMREPTFTFAHIILPHHPYIFDRYGNVKSNVTMLNQFQRGKWNEKEPYIDQLIFVNKKITAVIDAIIEKSDVAPIIVIQSDHGPQVPGVGKADFIRARMANFSAYYLPGAGSQFLYDSITSVNTFRLIFNVYFHTNYTLLEDKSYFSNYREPYAFMAVTDEAQDL
jgi:hypothetical protein